MQKSKALPHELKWLAACSYLSKVFSTCSKRQYAAVVVAPNKRIVGFGYNGSPPGVAHCTDGACPRAKDESKPGSEYDNCIAQHAEAGALLWSDPAQRIGSTIVVNGSPCMGCAKLIASSGVVRLVYISDSTYEQLPDVLQLLEQSGVECVNGYEGLLPQKQSYKYINPADFGIGI